MFAHAILFVLDNSTAMKITIFDIYVIADDLSETHCGTYDTDKLYGFEAWCNMEAKSFRIEGIPTDPDNWDVTICSFGAFGTIYQHDNPVTESLAL